MHNNTSDEKSMSDTKFNFGSCVTVNMDDNDVKPLFIFNDPMRPNPALQKEIENENVTLYSKRYSYFLST